MSGEQRRWTREKTGHWREASVIETFARNPGTFRNWSQS